MYTLFSVGTNVCIGLYLFGEKYANPEEYAAFWVMLVFFIIFAIIDVSFGFYQGIACKLKEDWVTPGEKEKIGGKDTDPPKKSPSKVRKLTCKPHRYHIIV